MSLDMQPGASDVSVAVPRTAQIALIIEDDPQFSNMLAAHLTQVGYRPVQCARGRDAITACALRPALITLDILLPDQDGWSALDEIRKIPYMQRVPVLIISILDAAELGPDHGPTSFLHKPARKEDLVRAIDLLLPEPQLVTRVLHVDDDPLMCELLAALLPLPRFEVQTAASAREAASLLQGELPHVIVLDLVMPRVSGFEFLQTLRADPRTCHLPVLVLTAKHLSPQEQLDLTQAAQVVLAKSDFTLQRLDEKLRHLQRATSLLNRGSVPPELKLVQTQGFDLLQFRDDFLAEAQECLTGLRDIADDRSPVPDAATLDHALRAAHTLKGAAAMMGYSALSEFAARAEALLHSLHDGEAELNSARWAELQDLHRAMTQSIDEI